MRLRAVAAGAGDRMKGIGIGKSFLRVLSHITLPVVKPTAKTRVRLEEVRRG
jgi:hypothetical protein